MSLLTLQGTDPRYPAALRAFLGPDIVPTITTAELAATRNRFVAALAERVLFVHAAPGSRTEALAREMIGWGKPVYALAHEANANLRNLGAREVALDATSGWLIQ